MVVHWRCKRTPGSIRSMAINGIGATVTGCTLLILAISKFTEGAWLTVLAFPLLVLLFLRMRRYHERLERETDHHKVLDVRGMSEPIIVIPLKRLDDLAHKALRLALTLSKEIHVVQILAEEMKTENLSHDWPKLVERPARESGSPVPKLVVVPSPFREFFEPLLGYIQKLAAEHHDRQIAVIVPELVERRWFHFLIPHRATLLKALLLLRGGPQILIVNTPWYRSETLKEFRGVSH
jgi:hypothetical protein